jgi:3-hydroxybutyryl-CoA dehydrogenase
MGKSTLSKVAVVGAGTMGNGIAQVFAMCEASVLLVDVNAAGLAKGVAAIEKSLAKFAEKGILTQEAAKAARERLGTATDLAAVTQVDLAVEAVSERADIKKKVFAQLDAQVPPATILATNTSSISITEIAAATKRADRVIGMHFMNPVPLMQLVELIRGIATDDATFQEIKELTERLGKTPVAAEDFPAFIVNRILLPMINEAVYTLYEGVGSVTAIDTAMKLGANHPMGPLELADFIGLDTCLSVMQVLYEGLADSKYRPCPLLVKYVEAGWLGRKVGRGFYDYSGDVPRPTR